MLKILEFLLCLSLLVLIFLRTPQNNGLASFSTKTNLLGSPSSAEQFLNNLTVVGIIIYLIVAVKLDLSMPSN